MNNRFNPNTSAEEIAASMRADGYAIVSGVLDPGLQARLESELAPWLEATRTGQEDFMGQRTKRFGALLAKCPAARELVVHPLVLEVTDKVLGPYCARFQINYTGVMYIEPGEKAQVMHRDTGIFPIQNPAPPMTLGTLWAMTDFTAENGATRLVSGSHLWNDERKPLPEEIVTADMSAGSVLLYTGNVVHGAGANRTNSTRGGLAMHYCLAWLRQEENQYLSMPIDEARKLPRRLQELMGYDLGTVNLGFVDHKHPNDFLNGVADEGPGVLGPQELMDADNAIQRMRVSDTAAVGRTRFDIAPESPSTS